MMTPRIAQIALRFGADDIDGTIVRSAITTTPEPPHAGVCAAPSCCT